VFGNSPNKDGGITTRSHLSRHFASLHSSSRNDLSDGIGKGNYLLYVGAIQPRKDLITLIRAFEKIKSQDTRHKIQTNYKKQKTNVSLKSEFSDLKLVLVGEVAWKSKKTIEAVENSKFKEDIILTGKVNFKELALFFRLAKVFVFPSLYEGFGIPILEAMASKTPVVIADNSSLSEIGGEAILRFSTGDANDLAKQVKKLLRESDLREKMIEKGLKRIGEFSWEKCAKKTLEILKSF